MAKDFEKGKTITMTDGSSVTVEKKLGEGGQGAVYLVKDASGKSYALKWYIAKSIIENDDFLRNLQDNVDKGAPDDNFIWPLKVARRQEGSYGYIMELRPEGFYELGDFFVVKNHPEARFASRQAQLRAALDVVNAFRKLRLKGLSYKDINDGNFFINPKTGQVLICDNDNVTADNIKGYIQGKVRYMAAEVVDGQAPNIDSDKFSLAVILYRLFMIDHPFEGKRTLQPCLTEDMQKKIYGKDMLFCWDADYDQNRPTKDAHPNSLYNWSHAPASLKAMFTKALSRNAVLTPSARVKDLDWKNLLLDLRAKSFTCPSGNHDILSDGSMSVCPRCKTAIAFSKIPKLDFGSYQYVVTPKKKVYLGESMKACGFGTEYQGANGSEPGIKNTSGSDWQLVTPSGKVRVVKHGESIPLRDKMHLVFDPATRCTVRY